MNDPELREALMLCAADLDETRDLALNGNKAVIEKVGHLSAQMTRIENLLVDVLRGDESRQRNFDQARKSDLEERNKDRSRIAKLELRFANGAR